MEGLVIEHGDVRFLVGVPHPTASTEAFAQATRRDAKLRKALGSSRSRLLHVFNHDELDKEGDRDHARESEAIYYDYSRNQAVRVRGHASGGAGLQIDFTNDQPIDSPEEFDEAVELVRQSAAWGPVLQTPDVHPYRPMPPVLQSSDGSPVERTLYVGLISKTRKFNRIVAVNMVRREVATEPARPLGARATDVICGVDEGFCIRPRRGTSGTLTLEWPKVNPVWSFQAIRPAASSGLNGSGIELRNVTYKGKRVLKQAHIPILNVNYDGDLCGPFRDWMYDEMCFQAVGTDVQGAPGFRWCTEPPQTIFESGVDSGNFTGVAVYDDVADGSLQLVTQCTAGWYRYVHEWRFYPDGTIAPRFRFGGTNNSCVCNIHHHHAFWRFDFDIIDKTNRVQEFVAGEWKAIPKESSRRRTPDVETRWRVLHKSKEIGYEIIPGEHDNYGDDFSGDDQYVFRYHKNEYDDASTQITQAKANMDFFIKKKPESVKKQDVVVWYVGHFRHNAEDEDEHLHEVGPTLVPINWPEPKPPRGRK